MQLTFLIDSLALGKTLKKFPIKIKSNWFSWSVLKNVAGGFPFQSEEQKFEHFEAFLAFQSLDFLTYLWFNKDVYFELAARAWTDLFLKINLKKWPTNCEKN